LTTVVAGLIERDGRLLICRRRPGDPHPLKWEFPGGKVEPEETPAQALWRELREELDIDAEIGPEVTRYEFVYPGGKTILLIFYRVNRYAGEPRNLVFEEMRWEPPPALPQFDFLEGDVEFVKRLATSA
jgi:8-oxo-dGTP diphosphatase